MVVINRFGGPQERLGLSGFTTITGGTCCGTGGVF